VLDLVAAPDGTLWAVSLNGLFSFDGSEWTRRFDAPTSAVAVDAAGTVWIGGAATAGGWPPAVWLTRWDGQGWVRVDAHPEWAPCAYAYGWGSLAVTSDGEVWIGGWDWYPYWGS